MQSLSHTSPRKGFTDHANSNLLNKVEVHAYNSALNFSQRNKETIFPIIDSYQCKSFNQHFTEEMS